MQNLGDGLSDDMTWDERVSGHVRELANAIGHRTQSALQFHEVFAHPPRADGLNWTFDVQVKYGLAPRKPTVTVPVVISFSHRGADRLSVAVGGVVLGDGYLFTALYGGDGPARDSMKKGITSAVIAHADRAWQLAQEN